MAEQSDTPFTVDQLRVAPAGTVFRAVYTAIPDPNYDTKEYTYTVFYSVSRTPVDPTQHDMALDSTSITEGQTSFPTFTNLPPVQAGYQAWGTPTFTGPNGQALTTGAQLAALRAGDEVRATYLSNVDNNHTGNSAEFVVKYTIAPATAP